jgi:subtilisin-like proprotein convertase family protein/pimeloyl-ACP methyl ester carboxylesterase
LTERTKLALLERAKLADSGRFLAPGTNLALAALTTAQGQALVDSLDIPVALQPTFVTAVSPDPDATTVRTSYGIFRSMKGNTFLLLSTGLSGNETITAEPGTDFALVGADDDISTLQFRVTVPPGVNRMSFDYTFLSAESPDFLGSQFNDTFTATVTDALGPKRVIATASVNTATFHPASETTVGPSPFHLLVDNPFGVNAVFNQPGFSVEDAGTTGFQRVDVPVASGPVTVTFDIRDLGDGILDSAVIIDNVQFSALEIVDPHSGQIDTFLGQVFHTPDPRLVSGGTPVRAAAADGVTEVLLRSNVPGPGTAVFSVTSGAASDGSLSGDDGPPVWGPTATTDAVLINGKWYVFALYRSPPDFNRSGNPADPTDTTVDKRSAPLSMVFTPTVGAPIRQDAAIDIVRPPVIVIPEIWSDCTSWTDINGILASHPSDPSLQHFRASCVDYQESSSKSFADLKNRAAIPAGIDQALQKLRDAGVAVTRADVVGHGMGGLLARRYIDEPSFIRFDNFNAGAINRLITVNTPHLGSRLADEFIRTRNAIKQRDQLNGTQNWQGAKTNLANAGFFFDDADQDVALQQMGANSSIINNIATNQATASKVFYHALFSTNGHDLLKSRASGIVLVGIKNYITIMENNHPSTINLPPGPSRQNLVYSPLDPTTNSIIFCSDSPVLDFNQHDLFATTWEQKGGLDSQFTTTFSVDGSTTINNNTAHFNVQNDPSHTSRLIELLNSSVTSTNGPFTNSMPSPGTVARMNNCPILPALTLASPTQAEMPLAVAQQTISITSPVPGATVTPGSSSSVTVNTNGGDQPLAVLITSVASSELVQAPPFTASVLIPAEAIGITPVSAIAFYDQGRMAFAGPVNLNVKVDAAVTAIQVLNGDQVLQRPGRTRQLTVIGTYSDGIRRDIRQAALGTRYTISQLGTVATVSANGLITAVGPGDATIAINNGAAITSVNVKVCEPACDDGAPNDFSITPNPTSQAVAAGVSTTYTINTTLLSGTVETINLSVSGLPAGVTGSFSLASVTAGGSSTLTLTAATTAAVATTSFTITGTAPSATHTAIVSVTVVNQVPTVSITSPTNGSTVSGTITVSANATDADGTMASVRFDLPNGTSVTDTTAPFSTTFDTTKVINGSAVFRSTATDNKGATSTASVTVTVSNCINSTVTSFDVPKSIPDNNAAGITSVNSVTGSGRVASLSLSLNITHPFRGDLVVTLISPGGTQFIVGNRAGGSAENIISSNQAITAFNGQTAAGTWQLRVQDLASFDVGTLNSWSLNIVGNCITAV